MVPVSPHASPNNDDAVRDASVADRRSPAGMVRDPFPRAPVLLTDDDVSGYEKKSAILFGLGRGGPGCLVADTVELACAATCECRYL